MDTVIPFPKRARVTPWWEVPRQQNVPAEPVINMDLISRIAAMSAQIAALSEASKVDGAAMVVVVQDGAVQRMTVAQATACMCDLSDDRGDLLDAYAGQWRWSDELRARRVARALRQMQPYRAQGDK